MKKALVQFIVLAIVFFGTWLLLSQIHFVDLFKVNQISESTEEKVGDMLYESIAAAESEEMDSAALAQLNKIKLAICTKNDIDTADIKIHLINKDDVNAFALPNGHLIVYTGLITECDKPEELTGVLGHEIAHIEHKHVMKKLVKEFGLTALISITSGQGGAVIGQIVKLLSSTAYDRKLESDADKTSVNYMLKANIDPEPFANFLYGLSKDEGKIPKQYHWISTHPESTERAKVLINYIKTKKVKKEPFFEQEEWEALKKEVGAM